MMFGNAAQQALTLAREALAKVDQETARREAHEDVCTERWRELRDDIKEFKKDQNAKHEDNKSSLRRILFSILGGAGLLALELLTKLIDIMSKGAHP